MPHPLLEPLCRSKPVQALVSSVRSEPVSAAFGVPEGLKAPLAAAIAHASGRPVVFVMPTAQAAARAAEDCAQLLPGGAYRMPEPDVNFARATASRDIAWWRVETLLNARRGTARVLCVSAAALMTPLQRPEAFDAATIRLDMSTRARPQDIAQRLALFGYERVDMVEGKGQCALRGSILDVFPPSEPSALRIEFFDDEIDSIRSFDFISQRSMEKRTEAVLPPAGEWTLNKEDAMRAGEQLLKLLDNLPAPAQEVFPDLPPLPEDDDDLLPGLWDEPSAPDETPPSLPLTGAGPRRLPEDAAAMAREGVPFPGFDMLAPLVCPRARSICDWLQNPIVLLCEPDVLAENARNRTQGFLTEFQAALERGDAIAAQQGLHAEWDDALASLSDAPRVTVCEFLRGQGGLAPTALHDFDSVSSIEYHGRFDQLCHDAQGYLKQNYGVLLLSGGTARGKRLESALIELGLTARFAETPDALSPGACAIAPFGLSRGFLMRSAGLCVLADADIWGAGYQRARARKTSGERIEAFTDLHEGDYVVHEEHGVGIYRGTTRLQSEGAFRDYLLIEYAGTDKLYIPTEQFDRVRRFIGGEGAPTLNKLGGTQWTRQKQRVKAGLKELAFDLVALYASRQAQPGFAFSKDNPWQRQFEDDFPYEPTPDQAQALREIYADMEAPINMDRLLCGDVGYGKTEVALRAAFKAIMDGKQVAFLAPTTILAQQHFMTVTRRFASFPVKADMLSRFRSPKAQKETLKALAEGKLDILIGTHRMLGKDVRFHNLGLLIVDEEQRFGVAHKEQIKNIKKQVDVLTLSATPIPRTLHMSMVGIRDMSLLETPPEGRYPVKTYVLDYADGVLRDAILRELQRDGQVYFLYNRVRSIESFCARLRTLVPEARIAVAHGQMREHALEDVMMDFYQGRYDVLLCSTIIENGLDIPRANTLIVYDADRFGLSQLYQLRGRVGRSGKMAYAYFTVRPNRAISETAQKRLAAIREFTEFGSGFRIAMRDLEIRGAGNVLGPEQSGQISAVGYDMYCKLIEETVREARGGVLSAENHVDTRVELKLDAYLPTEYVRGERQRLEVYKRISMIGSEQDMDELTEELIDRFGDVPESVIELMCIARLRSAAARLGVERVTHAVPALTMRFAPDFMPDPARLYDAMQKTDARLVLSASAKNPSMLLRDRALDADQMLRAAAPLLEKLYREMNPPTA